MSKRIEAWAIVLPSGPVLHKEKRTAENERVFRHMKPSEMVHLVPRKVVAGRTARAVSGIVKAAATMFLHQHRQPCGCTICTAFEAYAKTIEPKR